MAGHRLVLFDDHVARDWMPFVLTRPVGELLHGVMTLCARAERAFGTTCIGHLTSDYLRGFDEPGTARVLDHEQLPRDADLVFLSSRAVPPLRGLPELRSGPALLGMAGEVCGWVAPAGAARPTRAFLDDPAGHAPRDVPIVELGGRLLRRVWELVSANEERTRHDILELFPNPPRAQLPTGVYRIGEAPLILGGGVKIEPGVVFDLTDGPVWLGDGVIVRAFSRIAGPVYAGPGTTLLGGPYCGVTIGPCCKVHGEMEATVVLGHSNKAHDGFLGHAYLGRWVNLGAMTTNSDLKNNYGTISLWTPAGDVDTGSIKMGSLIGDHVKTGIGTILNTGTVIGAGTNVFGGAMPPKYVRPFSWGSGSKFVDYDLEKFLQTARTVMARRDVELSESQGEMLRAAWRHASSQRDT